MSGERARSDAELLARLRHVADDLAATGTDMDPQAIRAVDNWQAWRHRDMVALVEQITSGTGGTPGHEWSALGAAITEDFAAFDEELNRALGEGWQGAAADSAAAATTPIGQWGQQLGQVTAVTGVRMLAADLAAQQARTHLPVPQDFDWQRAMFAPDPELDLFEQHTAQENAKAEAVRVMDTFITGGYREADATVPAFPEPPGLVQGSAPVEYGPGGSYLGAPTSGGSYPMWTGLGVPVPFTESSTAPAGATGAPVPPTYSDWGPAQPTPQAVPGGAVGPVVPLGQEVTTQTSAASVFGGSGASSAGAGGYSGGGYSGSAAAPPAASAGQDHLGGGAAAGGRGPVQPGMTAAFARPLAENPRPATGAAPMGGGMPMGGAGAHGGGDDDAEHRSKYVVEGESGSVFSHGLSSVTPVIGETQ
ncbi:PPE domain-containing protein [Actinokineospora bangkokensis]|uniref:PPE domain-containing protein n=1 Tax=Actinokineospora bangkokensis TaxID=1193682 RepID=A0A1Q9LDA3_9PSEU|nr:hypothetical protein [Actinokineospora bangkokensis]OLR89993.1 hypothetical protein BJP25_03155 [Actinokineospora bangkokensis]